MYPFGLTSFLDLSNSLDVILMRKLKFSTHHNISFSDYGKMTIKKIRWLDNIINNRLKDKSE